MTPPLAYNHFYSTTLKPELRKAEAQRKQILINYAIIGIVLILGFGLEAITWMSIGIAIVVIFILAYTHTFGISKSDFVANFQSTTARLTANYIIRNALYDYNSYHKLKHLNEALLINGFPQQYGGKHMIRYSDSKISIHISEIDCHNNHADKKRHQQTRDVFKGLVGIAQVQMYVDSPILIMSDKSLGDMLQEIDPLLSDPVSRNEFLIYNLDHAALNMCISPSAWLLLKNYTESFQKSVFISLYSDGICVAIESTEYLKPGLSKTIYRKEFSEPYYNDLNFISQFLHLFCKNYTKVKSLEEY